MQNLRFVAFSRCQILCQSVDEFLGVSTPKSAISYTYSNDPYNSSALPCRLWCWQTSWWCHDVWRHDVYVDRRHGGWVVQRWYRTTWGSKILLLTVLVAARKKQHHLWHVSDTLSLFSSHSHDMTWRHDTSVTLPHCPLHILMTWHDVMTRQWHSLTVLFTFSWHDMTSWHAPSFSFATDTVHCCLSYVCLFVCPSVSLLSDFMHVVGWITGVCCCRV